MIQNLKEVCGAVWQKKSASEIGGLLAKPESGGREGTLAIVSEVITQMDEMKNYGYDNAYFNQVKGAFVKAMAKADIDLTINIVPILESIDNGILKQNIICEIASYYNEKGNKEAADILRPRMDLTGGTKYLYKTV